MITASLRARATSAFLRPTLAASASNQAFKAGGLVLRNARHCAASNSSERSNLSPAREILPVWSDLPDW